MKYKVECRRTLPFPGTMQLIVGIDIEEATHEEVMALIDEQSKSWTEPANKIEELKMMIMHHLESGKSVSIENKTYTKDDC